MRDLRLPPNHGYYCRYPAGSPGARRSWQGDCRQRAAPLFPAECALFARRPVITQTVHFQDLCAEDLEPLKESAQARLILKRAVDDGLDRLVVRAEMFEVS